MKMIRRISALALAGLLILTLTGCAELKTSWEQASFDTFISDQVTDTLESSYLAARTYLSTPEDVDPEAYNLGLRFSQEEMDTQREGLRELADRFGSFDRSLLTAEQQDLYDMFAYQLDLAVRLSDEKFDYYAPLFESMSGLHYQLASLFSDWEMRDRADAEALVSILRDVDPYIGSALAYTREQASRGLLMTDLDAVASYCAGIVEQGMDSSILAAMLASADTLEAGAQLKEDLKTRLTQAFRDSFLPAYQAICDTMAELKSAGSNNTGGLASLPYGREYYELLLMQSAGANTSVEAVRTMMKEAYDGHLEALRQSIVEHPAVIEPLLTGSLPETGYTSYEEILEHLKGNIVADFPEVANLNYEIRAIQEEVASDSGVAAYFNIPPLDGDPVQQLRVNPATGDIGSIDTYATVAHEGFPGHMYQYAYMYQNVASDYVKVVASVPAYTEGFAVYAQYESLAYLEGIDPALMEVYRENELVSYCAIILCDIGIHYDGWSLQEFTDFLNGIGFALEGEAAAVQYNQLWANPCAFEPYYVGYETFAALREQAEEALGDSFDAKSFHQALLQSGTAPFFLVERNVQAYIDSARTPAA